MVVSFFSNGFSNFGYSTNCDDYYERFDCDSFLSFLIEIEENGFFRGFDETKLIIDLPDNFIMNNDSFTKNLKDELLDFINGLDYDVNFIISFNNYQKEIKDDPSLNLCETIKSTLVLSCFYFLVMFILIFTINGFISHFQYI